MSLGNIKADPHQQEAGFHRKPVGCFVPENSGGPLLLNRGESSREDKTRQAVLTRSNKRVYVL